MATCHPDKFPELKTINTIVCEQINFWLSKYKYITKHMLRQRFIFFLFIIFDFYNEIKCQGKFQIAHAIPLFKSTVSKRKLAEITEDDYE